MDSLGQAALRTLLKHDLTSRLAWLLCQLGKTSIQASKILCNSHKWPSFNGLATTVILDAMFVVHSQQPGRTPRFSRLQPARPAPKCAHVKKLERRTTVRKTGVSKPKLVAAAVRLAGGPGAAATICGVSRQTIYDWINGGRVERLIDALRLSRASGVAIENLAGDDVEKLFSPVQIPRLKRGGRRIRPNLRVASQHVIWSTIIRSNRNCAACAAGPIRRRCEILRG